MTQEAPIEWVSQAASGGGHEDTSRPAVTWHHPTIYRRRPGSTMALLRRWRDLRAIYIGRRLDPGFREELMLAVAAANSCRQCSFAHREWALAVGVPKEEIAALEGMDAAAFDAREWTAIMWVQAAARTDFTTIPDGIDAEFRKEFGAREQSDIELIARLMYWMNEISNGVDVAWARVTGKPAEGSLLRGAEALLLYALFVPYVVFVVGARQHRTARSLLGGIRPFFREFEQRMEGLKGVASGSAPSILAAAVTAPADPDAPEARPAA